ncbi:MAG: 50S ribosomal protein L2 [Candidatus Abawacabacteria bacterium]|nr:50S ribosomal protein L2 [Candidatus Abawacabacteria bacterium]
MPTLSFKPTTPGRRHGSKEDFSTLTRDVKPEKKLLQRLKENAGRNNQGRITVRHRGSGSHRKMYRVIDFTGKMNVPGVIKTIEYDPNRNVRIALVNYRDGDKRYILLPGKVKVGFEILTAAKAPVQPGNRMMLKNIPEGVDVFNLEIYPGRGGQAVRTAGSSARLMSLEGEYAQVKMPSGEIRLFNKECMATVGILSNPEFVNVKIGKAGRNRWKGIRPTVRGKAMNPNDHPHGGGEGRNPIGMPHPKTPWGKPALGWKTRKNKRTNRWILRDSHGLAKVK